MTNPTIKAAALEALRRMLAEAPAHQERRATSPNNPRLDPLEAFACNCPRGLMVGCELDAIGGDEENILAALLELEEEGLVRPWTTDSGHAVWVAV